MKRTYALLTLLLCFLAFGYTKNEDEGIAKIYLIDDLLVRSDPSADIRLYSIANPAALQLLSTIQVLGNNDVAVKGEYMYADQNENLLVYDISNRMSPVAVDTIRNVFREIWAQQRFVSEPIGFVDQGSVGGASGCGGCGSSEDVMVAAPQTSGRSVSSGDVSEGSGGKGGSLARFAIVGNYLYCIDYSNLSVYDISDPAAPRYKNSVNVGWQIETLFPVGNELFIGSRSGMYRYTIAAPENPEKLSEFGHQNSCDPVVVEGTRAYVTLRGGTECGGYSNQMDILDITNRRNPVLLKTVPLDGPYGLTVTEGTAIVCDGASGVKIIDTKDLANIRTIATIPGIIAHDVILHNNFLFVTTTTGIWVYNVEHLDNPVKVVRLQF
jgi:hypothetical protein